MLCIVDYCSYLYDHRISLDKIFAIMGYNSDWKYQRREFHQYFHSRGVAKFRPVQRHQCRLFLRNVHSNPSQIGQYIRLYVLLSCDYKSILILPFFRLGTSIILKIVYDMDIRNLQDEYVRIAADIVSAIAITSLPGNFWVEFFPVLRYLPRWVPGTYFKRFAEHHKSLARKMLDVPFDKIKQQSLVYHHL